jgi:solute carrier family 30 (zinc transporter), member 5/7
MSPHSLNTICRAVLFTHFSSIWTKSIIEPVTIRKTAAVLLALGLSFVSDISTMSGDFRTILPAYVALVTHALSSNGLEHTQNVLSPALGSTFTTAASTLGACLLFLPLYMFREVLVSHSLPYIFIYHALT